MHGAFHSSDQSADSFASGPPIIVAGDSADALARGSATVAAAGLRIAGRCDLEQAQSRLDDQATTRALWVELDEDHGSLLDRLLDRINRDAGFGRYPVVIAAPARLIDSLSARITDPAIELIIDGDDPARFAGLAVAMSGAARATHVSDVSADNNANRLRQLSDEVGRIAASLARLSSGPAGARPIADGPSADGAVATPALSADTVRNLIRARRLRGQYFDAELFADPAWDMLLDLTQAEYAQHRVPVSSLCIAAAVPATTALRWIKTMVERGLFVRRADPHDGRRVFIELAPAASQAMRRYFADVGQPLMV